MKCVVARLAAAAAVWCLAAAPALAQSGTSSLTGRVTDPQQAVLPGATVTLTNTATATSRTAVTNESGLYSFTALPPGLYVLKVELNGFRTARVDALELRVDMQGRADVPLALGGVNETVAVQAESPIINTTDASLGHTLNEQAIRNLPVEARNVVQLLSLQPGVVFIPTSNPATMDPRTPRAKPRMEEM